MTPGSFRRRQAERLARRRVFAADACRTVVESVVASFVESRRASTRTSDADLVRLFRHE